MPPRGSNRRKGAPALPGAGRPPTTATLREGTIVFLSHVYPDGMADLGSGIVSEVKRINGSDRCIIIPQQDGSELRVVITE